ncbi:MAG: CCA tRNA nucleotidyltransferase [Gemmatimonadota bacterium]
MNSASERRILSGLEPPEPVRELAQRLEDAGYEAWAVGGVVRNALGVGEISDSPGQPNRSDWDLATDATPQEVQSLFRRTIPVGVEHGTVGVLGSDEVMYEVTTFRRDVQTDGRHAVVEFADSIVEDLSRRDFTINALAWRIIDGQLLDPHGGEDDLRRGLLRAVGNPEERFEEDYLRVLRGLRFAGTLGLEVEPETENALREAVPYLDRLSAERVREELLKTLAADRPSATLRAYGELGVLEVWYPELSGAALADSWPALLASIDRLRPHRPLLRVARLCMAEVAEPDSLPNRTESLLGRLKFSNADVRQVVRLVTHLPAMPGPMDSDATLREWLAEANGRTWIDVVRIRAAAVREGESEDEQRSLAFVWRRLHGQILSHAPLLLSDLQVGGEDLIALGVPQGPAVGLLLEELHGEVLEDPELNEPERLLELARELMKMAGLGEPETP